MSTRDSKFTQFTIIRFQNREWNPVPPYPAHTVQPLGNHGRQNEDYKSMAVSDFGELYDIIADKLLIPVWELLIITEDEID